MAETHQVITKVWIAPGCIVCDACENDCPEVFDVQEDTCLIRPPAQSADFLRPLTPSIIVAAEGCPVEVIKFETKEVEGPAPWAGQPEGQPAAAAAGGGEVVARAPAAKVAAPPAPPDPKWQALISTSKVSPSMSAGLATTVRKSPEVVQAEEMVRAVNLPKNAPPDQKMAMLAVGGAYAPQQSMADRIRGAASGAGKTTRRHFNLALVIAWGAMAAVGATMGAMFQDFFGPKVLKEPKKLWRVGKLEEYTNSGVYEMFKKTPDGGTGFWMVNLQPAENRLVALNTVCTHLGCIPNWLSGDQKFKCPCHGSGYYITGVNFEGPTPRPLERFAVYKDADGYVWVDQTKIYRQELGQWDDPESFVSLG
jgi:cytochrome b6-f complex iron-sulfur subunit